MFLPSKVLRYSALIFGIGYGFTHQSSITATSKSNQIEAGYRKREDLILKAKSEWAKKTAPVDEGRGGKEGMLEPSLLALGRKE